MTLRPKRLPVAEAPLQATGYLDAVSDDGWVRGWAWYPDAPTRIVQLDILADGVPAGSVHADSLRDDLRQNGIGDGAHAFAFALPDAIVLRGRKTAITARDTVTRAAIGTQVVFERRLASDTQARIEELEGKARLLDSALAALAERQAQDAQAASRLFATVGNFFLHLADSSAAGRPEEAAGTLRTAIEDVQSCFEPIELEFASIPSVTVSVGTGASLASIYGTIRAIQQTSKGMRVEVLVTDDGSNPQICLLPLVITNLRYVRAIGLSGPIGLLNLAAKAARGKVLVHLAAGLAPTSSWLRDILTRYSTDPRMAFVGAKVTQVDGVLHHAGMVSTEHELISTGRGLDPSAPSFTAPTHVNSVMAEAFCVKLDVWKSLNGLDATCSDPNEALARLCYLVKKEGGKVIFEPRFAVSHIKLEALVK